MVSLMVLDQRKRLILNALINRRGYLTSGELSALSGVTDRTVRTDLKIIMDELGRLNLPIEASPGLGYRIPDHIKDEVRLRLDSLGDVQPVSPDERMFFIIRQLVLGPVRLAGLLELIFISESTLEKDLERCSSWFRIIDIEMLRCRNVIRLDLTRRQRKLVYIQYYSDLSNMSGISVETHLKNDFPEFMLIKKSLDNLIDSGKQVMSDDEYEVALISMLAEENSHAESQPENIIRSSSDHGILTSRISKSAEAALKKLDQMPPDDELIEALKSAAGMAVSPHSCPGTAAGLQELEKQYPEALSLSVLFLEQLQGFVPGEDYSLIISAGMCFAAFLERSLFKTRKRVSIICTSGKGSSQLLEAKLRRSFPNLDIIGVFPKHRLKSAVRENPDFIISTAELNTDIDVVTVTSFLDHKDYDRITPFLRKNVRGRLLFRGLITEEFFFTKIDLDTPEAVIHMLCSSAFGSEGEEFERRVLEREAMGSTAVGNLAALPHAVRGEIAENRICIGILNKPIRWGRENVQLVLLLRLDNPDIDMSAVFEYIYSLVSNKRLIRRIIDGQEFSLLSENTEGNK